MKIDPSIIIVDHFRTLKSAKTDKVSGLDVFIFYGLPIAFGLTAYYYRFVLSGEFYNISLTFYGVFVALLLNIQVAVFGIFQRKWEPSKDKKVALLQEKDAKARRDILREVNSNVSYLTLFSCIALVVFLGVYAFGCSGDEPAAVAVVIYSHFLLTLVMILKRAHALFRMEYEGVSSK